MNPAISFTRACARCSNSFRSLSRETSATLHPHRYLSTSAPRLNAQPIDLSSSTTPPSSAEESTLSHDIISRASVDSKPAQTSDSLTSPNQSSKPHPALVSGEKPTIYVGHVTRTSTMPKTVQITRQRQTWDKMLKKHYTRPLRLLAHDPNPANYLQEGDVVEYSRWTAEEELAKQQKVQDRLDRQVARAIEVDQKRMAKKGKQHGAFDPASGPTVRKLMRARAREEKEAAEGNERRKKGVQFVVRKIVTPFAVPLEERMDALNIGQEVPEAASLGGTGTDSLIKSRGGNISKQHASAAVAG